MLATRNLWILDINFNIFFSFATVQRLKSFYGFASMTNLNATKSHHHNHNQNRSMLNEVIQPTDYAF